jgi:ABC-type multidrug transport system ATPase subunit
MGFEKSYLNARICDLSGGQKRRLQLLLTLLKEPNVLILDEPGNDMDTDMLAVMEDLLDSWPGTLILVSHDRYLTERVTDDQFALISGKLCHVPGGVDEYLRLAQSSNQQNTPMLTPAQLRSVPQAPDIDNYQLQKQINSIERKLHTLVKKEQELAAAMLKADPTDYTQLVKLGEDQRLQRQEIQKLEDAWLEKSQLLNP